MCAIMGTSQTCVSSTREAAELVSPERSRKKTATREAVGDLDESHFGGIVEVCGLKMEGYPKDQGRW